MTDDILFAHLERLHAGRPWGRVLDAGSGRDSLRWIAGLDSEHWTAITADQPRADRLAREFRRDSRPSDRVIAGNWNDPALLWSEVFDVVVADYLVGAVDRFAPNFQSEIFRRLRPHVGDRLYAIGLEPYDETATTPGGRIVLDIARLRDACILHAGHRCHREYPLDWVLARLEDAGFAIDDARSFPIVYGPKFVNGQLDVCVAKLASINDPELARGLRHRIEDLRRQALALYESHQGIHFGADWVVAARAKL